MSNTYLYISNPDGSKRWLWPIENKQPDFLNFYNASTLKQKVFRLFVRFVFKCNLQSSFFRKTEETELSDLPESENWALFYGTPGPNNKKVLFYKDEKGKRHFVKIAETAIAQLLIHKEKEILNELRVDSSRHSFVLPAVIENSIEGRLELSDVPLVKSLHTWGASHNQAITYFKSRNATKSKFENWSNYNHINHQLSELSHMEANKIPMSILNKLILLKIDIDRNEVLDFHMAHGDFTPWNAFETTDKKLGIIDWELSLEYASKGYDFFHFHLQNGILVERKTPLQILKNISEIGVSQGVFENKKELWTYFRLYLLQHVSYYALVYAKQEFWHTQINWQLQVWEELLNEMIEFWNDRKLFITDLFEELKNKNYAGLKLQSGRPEDLNEYSDIDLIIEKSNVKPLIKWIKNRSHTQAVFVKKRSNAYALTVLFKDGTRLYLDLIIQLKRKGIEFMSSRAVLANSTKNLYGIKEASPKDTALYIGLFYGLNRHKVPTKYIPMSKQLLPLQSHLEIAVYQHFMSIENSKDNLQVSVAQLSFNKKWKGAKNKLNYALDSLKSFFKRKGMIITLSGVDGAGKTTVINELKYVFDKKYRKPVVVLRHRPSIIPILSAFKYGKIGAEKRSVESLPRQGANSSILKSLLRFSYYYADYFFGQFYIYVKYVLRGYIVIYDRYYFDMMNDSKRSNMNLPKVVTSFGYAFLLKPNFNFFLYANPDTILQRKQELDRDTINDLTFRYKFLFHKLQGRRNTKRYVSINNEVLSQTTKHIFQTIGNIY